jgi:hypothetical protein
MASQPITIDILSQPTEKRLRKEIVNICGSYNHPWDILAELCQNSVDAIRRHQRVFGPEAAPHRISLTIDGTARSIEVTDTGCGIDGSKLAGLLAPHGTDKDDGSEEIGEKGVGLTYTIYMSNLYEIDTQSVHSLASGQMQGAAAWKNGHADTIPMFTYTTEDSEVSPASTHCRIKLSDIEELGGEEGDLFDQPVSVVKYWLRARTALGDTNAIFDSAYAAPFSVVLTHVDKAGEHTEEVLPSKYMLPEEFVAKKDVLQINDELYAKLALFGDSQKRQYLHSKSLVKVDQVYKAGRWIRYYAFAASSRDLWSDICQAQNLVIDEDGSKRNLFEGAITTATKGMPTGINISPPSTGWAGYWPNMFILLQDDALSFDLGRKSLPGRTVGLLRDIAKEIFNETYKLLRFSGEGTSGVVPGPADHWEREQMLAELRQLPDLGASFSNFLKQPSGQEAAVVALFHELVGRGLLKGYYTYTIGYKMTYDEWGQYRVPKGQVASQFQHFATASGMIEGPIVIEFKYAAEDLLKDLENSTKYFPAIDLLVCWDVDEQKFAQQGIQVRVITDDDRFFQGSNFSLAWPGPMGQSMDKAVLALRPFIQNLIAQGPLAQT